MTAIHLGAALPQRSSHLPADSASSVIVRLLDVAPDGGCRVSPAAGTAATRLCGPVPRLRRLAAIYKRPGVTRHPALRSPDFPLPCGLTPSGQRRSGGLRVVRIARAIRPTAQNGMHAATWRQALGSAHASAVVPCEVQSDPTEMIEHGSGVQLQQTCVAQSRSSRAYRRRSSSRSVP